MRRTVFKKSFVACLRSIIAPTLFTSMMLIMAIAALRHTEASSKAEGLRVLEEGLKHAVIQCYLVEGSYPESLAYIENHYGVHINRTKYAVHYRIFVTNIMPEITVIEIP